MEAKYQNHFSATQRGQGLCEENDTELYFLDEYPAHKLSEFTQVHLM